MDDHCAEQQCVTREREHVGEVERDSVRRALEDERVGNALRPHEHRDEVAERASRGDRRADQRRV